MMLTETVSLTKNTIDRDSLFSQSCFLTETLSLMECMSVQFNQLEDEWESGSLQLSNVHTQNIWSAFCGK